MNNSKNSYLSLSDFMSAIKTSDLKSSKSFLNSATSTDKGNRYIADCLCLSLILNNEEFVELISPYVDYDKFQDELASTLALKGDLNSFKLWNKYYDFLAKESVVKTLVSVCSIHNVCDVLSFTLENTPPPSLLFMLHLNKSLTTSSLMGNLKISNVLLKKGAQPNPSYAPDFIPLPWPLASAIKSGHQELIDLLFDISNVEDVDKIINDSSDFISREEMASERFKKGMNYFNTKLSSSNLKNNMKNEIKKINKTLIKKI